MNIIARLNIFLLLITPYLLSSDSNYPPTNQELFEGKKIVITGGTGYLGRALITELLKYNPAKIVIFSRDEVKHFNVANLFNNNPKIQSIVGDVRDYDRVLEATRSADIVIHAAAHKRIDMMESNVEEVIKTNILGSLNVFKACITNHVAKVIFTSTDKACAPVNAYGACKFLSEKIFTNYDAAEIETHFIVARYGNVLESTGSIIPIIIDRIKSGKNLLLTDMRMTRFIVSQQEAVELVFDALRYGQGGEIFVRRVPSMRLIDLMEILKAKYNADNTIQITGLRPGEKIHEVLVNESETSRTVAFEDYFIIRSSVAKPIDQEDVPLYLTRGTPFISELPEFSSRQAIISKEDLESLFKKLGLL